MARLIVKAKYFDMKNNNIKLSGYIKYIATREGVIKVNSSNYKDASTTKQNELIEEIIRMHPEAKFSKSYIDFAQNNTKGNASDFINEFEENLLLSNRPDSGYVEYIANRKGSVKTSSMHGLFSDNDKIDLKEVCDSIDRYDGNIFSFIISLKREDAHNLGYESPQAFRDLIISNRDKLAETIKVKDSNLNWYAAFHDEGNHPHIHMIAYSSDPKEGYLNDPAIKNFKGHLMRSIFKDELKIVYEGINSKREELTLFMKKVINGEIQDTISKDRYDRIEHKMKALKTILENHTGKKVYKYLKPEAKDLVNSILDDLSGASSIENAFDVWKYERNKLFAFYGSKKKEERELKDIKEFKVIKNAIVAAALNASKKEVMALVASDDEIQEAKDTYLSVSFKDGIDSNEHVLNHQKTTHDDLKDNNVYVSDKIMSELGDESIITLPGSKSRYQTIVSKDALHLSGIDGIYTTILDKDGHYKIYDAYAKTIESWDYDKLRPYFRSASSLDKNSKTTLMTERVITAAAYCLINAISKAQRRPKLLNKFDDDQMDSKGQARERKKRMSMGQRD